MNGYKELNEAWESAEAELLGLHAGEEAVVPAPGRGEVGLVWARYDRQWRICWGTLAAAGGKRPIADCSTQIKIDAVGLYEALRASVIAKSEQIHVNTAVAADALLNVLEQAQED